VSHGSPLMEELPELRRLAENTRFPAPEYEVTGHGKGKTKGKQ
jgi:hypothetical protein